MLIRAVEAVAPGAQVGAGQAPEGELGAVGAAPDGPDVRREALFF